MMKKLLSICSLAVCLASFLMPVGVFADEPASTPPFGMKLVPGDNVEGKNINMSLYPGESDSAEFTVFNTDPERYIIVKLGVKDAVEGKGIAEDLYEFPDVEDPDAVMVMPGEFKTMEVAVTIPEDFEGIASYYSKVRATLISYDGMPHQNGNIMIELAASKNLNVEVLEEPEEPLQEKDLNFLKSLKGLQDGKMKVEKKPVLDVDLRRSRHGEEYIRKTLKERYVKSRS